jgi:predicted MFS family arabinose efflux permease
MPQSPRWLATRNRIIEARLCLAKIRRLPPDSVQINTEMTEITDSLNSTQSSWSQTLTSQNLHRLSLGIPFIIFQQFLGQNLLNYYSPLLFKTLGLDSNGTDLLATGVIGVVKIIMTLPALIAVDRYGRRPLMLTGTVLMALSFYYIGYYTSLDNTTIGVKGYLVSGWFDVGYWISICFHCWICDFMGDCALCASVRDLSYTSPCKE